MGLSRTISEINGDFSQKSPKKSHHVFWAPANVSPLELGIGAPSQKKTRMMGLSDGQKSFKIGLTV